MLRILLSLGILVTGCFALPCGAEDGSSSRTVIRLKVSPAKAPKPALRYRLLPELPELSPGNPIQGYLKAILPHQKLVRNQKPGSVVRGRILAMPLELSPREGPREYGRLVLAEVDRAARLDRPDWQILPRMRTDGYSLLLPDVQELRGLANSLKARFHAEVAAGQGEEALRTAKTMLAMGQHLGEHPSIIGNLVGIAITNLTIAPLEEWITQPSCPNLYWALTSLPSPLISLTAGTEGERWMMHSELQGIREQEPMSADQIKEFASHWDRVFGNSNATGEQQRLHAWLHEQINDHQRVAATRRNLVKQGLPRAQLDRFSAAQVILLDGKLKSLARFDEFAKQARLPFWQIHALDSQAQNQSTDPGDKSKIVRDAIPNLVPARRAQARLDQRIALLRHVEALRLHAAEHQGNLPDQLSEITVPLPNDPMSGKPFIYKRNEKSALLHGSAPRGEEANPHFNIQVEITLSAEDPSAQSDSPSRPSSEQKAEGGLSR